ncbi:MAG: glycerate kinase [Pannonibacter sp.]
MAIDIRFAPLLLKLFDTAVAAAKAETALPPHLPAPGPTGRIILLAAGKAAGAMLQVAEAHYLTTLGLPAHRLAGLGVTRHGYARPTRHLELIEAGHPVPDETGVSATLRCLDIAASARSEDHVVVLLSGGASANWIAPAPGISLADKQELTRQMLRSGATIREINSIRKHLSRIKGGRLARAVPDGVQLTTLAISDVPEDDPAVIGSGPTVGDPTTLADAHAVCARHGIALSGTIAAALNDPANETPTPDDPVFSRAIYRLVARPGLSLDRAADVARAAGYEVHLLGDSLEGEARDLASEHAAMARNLAESGRKAVLLSGGELTVTIRGDGSGGPNQEYALALAIALDGKPGIAAVAGDTDGTDGGKGEATDPAGAMIDPQTLARARAMGLDAAAFLARNDSTGFFSQLGDLLTPGPTYTNVNDFRAVIVDKP